MSISCYLSWSLKRLLGLFSLVYSKTLLNESFLLVQWAIDLGTEMTDITINLSLSILKVFKRPFNSYSSALRNFCFCFCCSDIFPPLRYNTNFFLPKFAVIGAIGLVRPLDLSRDTDVKLVVIAVDDGQPPLTSTATILVQLKNVNKYRPQFTQVQSVII